MFSASPLSFSFSSSSSRRFLLGWEKDSKEIEVNIYVKQTNTSSLLVRRGLPEVLHNIVNKRKSS